MGERYVVKRCEDVPSVPNEYDCWVIVDTETGDSVGEDGGEPEDQLLVRDWSWVAPALNAASERGRLRGIEQAEAVCSGTWAADAIAALREKP
ncbi:unnamed protein product [marine sediment metagenome]|uniref:Uncharacterized protein n=1 Tax=marine sediment metagenome TaxID=412755 RepID=X0SYR6_9ZZZZ